MQTDSDQQVAAFYARVMRRVCSSYQEESGQPEDAVRRLQQKWEQKLSLYTGSFGQTSAEAREEEVSVVAESASDEASDGESSVSSVSSLSSSSSSALSDVAVGRPSAELPRTATSTSSVFAKMLGGKRKLNQLDGSVSDDDEMEEHGGTEEEQDLQVTTLDASLSAPQEDSTEEGFRDDEEGKEGDVLHPTLRNRYAGEEKADVNEDDGDMPSSSGDSTASTSALVSAEDLAPISGLSGINLPLQLAAECLKFGRRGIRQGYVGDMRAIVLTWPSRLRAKEVVLPGELVWCYGDEAPNSDIQDGIVEVLSLDDTLRELTVKLSNGTETTVQMNQVRRLKEYLIRKGTIRLRGN